MKKTNSNNASSLLRRLTRRVAFCLTAAAFLLTSFCQQAKAQVTYALTPYPNYPVAATASSSGALVSANTGPRGAAYDSVSNLVYVAQNTGKISAFGGVTGAYLGDFNMTGVSGGTFIIDQIGVAADGAIYGINLSTSSGSATKVYRWATWTAAPTVAFSGNTLVNGGTLTPSAYTSGRVGDTFAVTGSGANTLLLAGVGGKPYFAFFFTSDGLNFTNTVVNLNGTSFTAPGGNIFGICFYTNNTFLAKTANSSSGSANTLFQIQAPSNYASTTVVNGTVLASVSLGATLNNSTTMLNYTPNGGGLLAAIGTGLSSMPVNLFGAANMAGGIAKLCTTNASQGYNGGNATGATALGGAGNTNVIYAYNTGNGIFAFNITNIPPVPPTITAAPAGGTFFLTDTLSVSATGTTPFGYQWLASNSVAGTFTNIPSAITNTLTITASTNFYRVVITNIAGAVTSSPVQVAILTPTTSTVVTQLWCIVPGSTGYSYLTTGDDNRGVAYDTNSQRVVVASRSPGLYILDGNTGTNIGSLSMAGVSGGTYAIDQVGIADDGAVYAGNLILAPSAGFTLYRWNAPITNSVSAVAFQDSTGSALGNADRWGDTMAVRGSGASTQIILGSRSGTNVALLTTSDGITFSGQVIAISNAPAAFAGLGITFGGGNTFYAKNNLGHLYQISFDPVNSVGGILFDYPNPSKTPTYMTAIGADPANNILAGIDLGDTPNDVKLFQLTGTSDAPVLFHQAFFPTVQANGNQIGAVTMKYPKLYALDVNNGLVALTYGNPPTTPPAVITPPANQSSYTNNPALTLNVSVSGSLPLYYQWQFSTASNGPFANLGAATASTYTLNYPQPVAAGYYRVIVRNVGGYATSAPPALLTVLLPTTSVVVTQLWTVTAGSSLSFLDATSYQTRGMAFDTNTLQLVVADHNNLHILNATNGAYLGDLNVAGVPTSGYNSWLFDQVGFSDDGYLFAGNLAGVGGSGTFSVTAWAPPISVGAGPSVQSYANSDPGNGSGDRWGDTMAVRGNVSDGSAQVLLGSWNGTNVVIFTSDTSGDLTPNVVAVSGVPLGFSGQGITFGVGNTFWSKSPQYDLRLVSFNTNTTPWTGTVIYDFFNGSQVPSAFGGIGVDSGASILGGVNFGNTPNDFQLYLLSGNSNPPSLVNQAFFGLGNLNIQQNSVATLKGGYGFALDVNNGMTAVTYGIPNAPAVTITSIAYAPGNVTINWNKAFVGHSYQVQTTTNLLSGWTNLGTPVTTINPTASYTDTSAAQTTQFYRVVSQ